MAVLLDVWLHTIVLPAQVLAAGQTFLELVPALILEAMYSLGP